MKTTIATVILCAASLFAQSPIVTVAAPSPVTARAGETTQATLSVKIVAGFHANSNTPADPFLIPLSLTWSPGPLESQKVVFPQAETRKLSFSAKPASVFSGDFPIVTQFKTTAGAAPGVSSITGKLHYQACDDHSCRPPATLTITLPVEITKN